MASSTENKNIDLSVQDMIISYHNPALVQQNASPNGNWIYHIYSDGEITHQKGGFAYLMRSELSEKNPVYKFKKKLEFPMKGPTHSYAIVTKEHAILIRGAMIAYTLKHLV
jgi:hypothetical protein